MESSNPFGSKNSPENRGEPAAVVDSLRSLRIIFVVMFFSVVAYALIGTFLKRDLVVSDYDIRQVYRIFSFLGGALVAALLLIRNLLNRTLLPREEEGGRERPDPRPRFSRFVALSIIAFAISEAIALLGFVYVLMGGHRGPLYFFCGIALACLILFFPRPVEF